LHRFVFINDFQVTSSARQVESLEKHGTEGPAMRRTMNFETLQAYISNAQATLMLCKAHADYFDLNSQELEETSYRIDCQIDELMTLKEDLVSRNFELAQLNAKAIKRHMEMPRKECSAIIINIDAMRPSARGAHR
jgi:hypothetical protein